jgi:hypothetical protein
MSMKNDLEKQAQAFCDSIEVDGSIGHIHTAMANFVLWLESVAPCAEEAWFTVSDEWKRKGLKPGAFTAFVDGFNEGRGLYTGKK